MKAKLMLLTAALGLGASSHASIVVNDTFSYTDGNLAGNSPAVGGSWTNHSGTPGEVQVSSGTIILTPNSSSEDINTAFNGGPVSSGTLFYGFDMSVASFAGSPDEYFAHFKDDGTDFTSRLHMEAADFGGDYTLGISGSSSAPDANWGSDLTFGQTYRIVVGFDFTSGVSNLWINPTSTADTNITSAADSVPDLEAFAFRQSGSGGEVMTVDNLIVGTEFSDVAIPEPSMVALVLIGFLGIMRTLRARK